MARRRGKNFWRDYGLGVSLAGPGTRESWVKVLPRGEEQHGVDAPKEKKGGEGHGMEQGRVGRTLRIRADL